MYCIHCPITTEFQQRVSFIFCSSQTNPATESQILNFIENSINLQAEEEIGRELELSLHIRTYVYRCMHIRKRTGKRVLNEIGKHDILFLLHFNLLSKQQPVCIIKVIFFTRIFSLRFWHSLFKWNFKCITTYRMQNALAMLRLSVCVCVRICILIL